MSALPFRQIHLDFHTSEAIAGIGRDWSPEHFRAMLRLGHVNSITVFAKCHHGWSYYPTSVPEGAMHPHLGFDLLGEMLDACRAEGVRAPVYLSAGVDEQVARRHSEWMRRERDGSTRWQGWLEAGFHELCMRSPYLEEVLLPQIDEVMRRCSPDAIFLDIVGLRTCHCQYCIDEHLRRDLDPRDAESQATLGRELYLHYTRRVRETMDAVTPGVPVFHNGGHIKAGDRELAAQNSHLELESLPTGGWSYDHFPVSARYVQGLGMSYLGMSGKFHSHWGEFGGYKHPNALRFEAALSLANGARCSVGDQMHPYGKLDEATYRLIGAAYAEVEAKEPWCEDVESVADVGVLSYEAASGEWMGQGAQNTTAMIMGGVVRTLQEGHVLYDVLDTESDFSRYKVLVLPDAIPVRGMLRLKLQAYLDAGGRIFATGTSALDRENRKFVLDFGAYWLGEGMHMPVYVSPRVALGSWAMAGHVAYSTAQTIAADGAAEVLADLQEPFFNRDYRHFCSHMHAPSTLESAGPAMVRTANTAYLAVPGFQLYARNGQVAIRDITLLGLRSLLTEPTLTTDLPSQGIQTLMRDRATGRLVAHLLYGAPVRRGLEIPTRGNINSIEVIEDLPPIHDVNVSLRMPQAPRRVYLAPQDEDLPFTYTDGVVRCTVPRVECHQMVVAEA